MTRLLPHPLLPHPLLFAWLWLIWLLLTQSFSPGQILLGALVAFLTVHVTARLRLSGPRMRAPGAALRLFALVVADVIRSNLAVSRLVLSRAGRGVSGFVRLPLELTDPVGLTVLAIVITATPGTMWVEYNRGRNEVLIHVLDLLDEDEWVRQLKRRYEALLLRIFER